MFQDGRTVSWRREGQPQVDHGGGRATVHLGRKVPGQELEKGCGRAQGQDGRSVPPQVPFPWPLPAAVSEACMPSWQPPSLPAPVQLKKLYRPAPHQRDCPGEWPCVCPRFRWQKVLNPELIKGPWTKDEDETVIKLVRRSLSTPKHPLPCALLALASISCPLTRPSQRCFCVRRIHGKSRSAVTLELPTSQARAYQVVSHRLVSSWPHW